MTEQGNTAWGLTVSRRFDSPSEATSAVDSLRQAGFREEEIRVWQHRKSPALGNEDSLARTIEGLLGGGVIGGLAGFFFSIAISWAANDRTTEESSAIATLIGAVAGAIIVAAAVSVISRRFSFGHHDQGHGEPASVVTVTVGDRESEAKRVFDQLSAG